MPSNYNNSNVVKWPALYVLSLLGPIYHITARGNDGRSIYEHHDDRWDFLGRLKKVSAQRRWNILAFCLMGNHYHLVLKTREANLARGMGQLNGGYAQFFNKQHEATGHLFQARYRALIVQEGGYLLNAIRYTVLNPVRAGLCERPEQHPYGSYCETVSVSRRDSIIDAGAVLGLFGDQLLSAREAFKRFVADGNQAPSIYESVRAKYFLGDESFVLRHTKDLPDERLGEIPKGARPSPRPPLDRLVIDLGDLVAICEAHRTWDYSVREIGRHVGKHYSTISRIISQCEGESQDGGRHTPLPAECNKSRPDP